VAAADRTDQVIGIDEMEASYGCSAFGHVFAYLPSAVGQSAFAHFG
jgi:hypothetical protein